MIYKTLKQLRTSNGLTQKQVAEVLKIERSTYAYYELGKTNPDITSLVKIARLYNVSLDSLISGKKPNTLLSDSGNLNSMSLNTEIQKFSELDDDEKMLILLFRSSNNKQAMIDVCRELSFANDEDEDS